MNTPGDTSLRAIIAHGGELELPYFDGRPTAVGPAEFESPNLLPALKNFLTLTGENRLAHSRHVFAYHQLMVDECGNPLTQPPHPEQPEDIWRHGHPSYLSFTHLDERDTSTPSRVVVEVICDVTWEGHGVSLFFDNGEKLYKVSHGQDDAQFNKAGRIFDCYRDEFCTYPDH